MKIKDYKLFLESTLLDTLRNEYVDMDIESICKYFSIKNYSINDDGSIDVDCNVNLRYTRLTKLPLKFGKVTGDFYCSQNNLTTLEGCPKFVGGVFSCSGNQLTTLEGGPKTVLGEYYCSNNQLVNFKGFPEDYEEIGVGSLSFDVNPVTDIIYNIPFFKWNKFIYWCNEYDAITDEGKVIPERMEEVYNKLGMVYED